MRSSSNIRGYSYNEQEKTLDIQFNNGGTYRYKDVPQELYEGFNQAESLGRFLHANIKNKFETVKLT